VSLLAAIVIRQETKKGLTLWKTLETRSTCTASTDNRYIIYAYVASEGWANRPLKRYLQRKDKSSRSLAKWNSNSRNKQEKATKHLKCVHLTIILRGCAGYQIIDSQRGAKRRNGYNHLISSKPESNNSFNKNEITNYYKLKKQKRRKRERKEIKGNKHR